MMLLNNFEVNEDNLRSWSVDDLRKMQNELNKLLEEQKGDYREEVLLLRLMTIEIKRQVKIQNINTAAAKAIEQLKKEVNNRAWRSRNISLK